MLMINLNKNDGWPIYNKSYQVINTSENVMSLTYFLFFLCIFLLNLPSILKFLDNRLFLSYVLK